MTALRCRKCDVVFSFYLETKPAKTYVWTICPDCNRKKPRKVELT